MSAIDDFIDFTQYERYYILAIVIIGKFQKKQSDVRNVDR